MSSMYSLFSNKDTNLDLDVDAIKRRTESEENDKKLQQLKERLKPLFKADASQSHSERSLSRFLRATGSVEAAYSDILRYNQWRKSEAIDDLSPSDPDVLEHLAKGYVHSLRLRDINGRPILYVVARKHNANERDLDKMTKFIVYMLELTLRRMDERVNDTLCLVFDLDDFSLSNMDYPFVKRLLWLLTRFYPERLGICIVYNAPVLFQGCWPIIRRWLHEATASKVIFVNGKEAMSQHLDINGLPPGDM